MKVESFQLAFWMLLRVIWFAIKNTLVVQVVDIINSQAWEPIKKSLKKVSKMKIGCYRHITMPYAYNRVPEIRV